MPLYALTVVADALLTRTIRVEAEDEKKAASKVLELTRGLWQIQSVENPKVEHVEVITNTQRPANETSTTKSE